MKFVNRTEEQARIRKIITGDKSGFIVVYGRRRCGKSTLLKRVLTETDIYFMADQTESTQQITLLAQTLSNVIPGFDLVKYPNWEALFTVLNQRITTKITLCLDEFPYLVKSSPELPATIQRLIDKGENRFHLIICGSSQQLMHGLIIDSTAPLYGRADIILKVRPMKLPYLQEILKCGAEEAITEFSIWGGVPRYWELRLQEQSLNDALLSHLFSPLGTLIEEPLRLFVDDMRDTTQSYTILTLIGNGVHRLSEIAARLEKPATSLAGPLDRLIQLGYIERELPFGENIRNNKKSYYRISDPFVNFYFTFVVPNRSLIELDKGNLVLERIAGQIPGYISFWWEKLCRQAISGIEVDGYIFGYARSWWGNVSKDERIEVDVVAESIDGKVLLVGECKWTEAENVSRLVRELEIKASKLPFAKGKEIIPCLFLKTNPVDSIPYKIFFPDDIVRMLK
ncbi:ATP-binding protein [Parabacteroides sp. FAFU027]|uniref:ATP-binding protein n=1 Tax=Parabacteroides sp. FAFU027 TaxID=2922715 RepID=UPI001FAF09B8|nr:ATP-binding protein [Parabacteroides sp. FAFU027]